MEGENCVPQPLSVSPSPSPSSLPYTFRAHSCYKTPRFPPHVPILLPASSTISQVPCHLSPQKLTLMPLINVPLQLGGKLLALSNLSPHYHSHHPGSKCAHCCSLMDTSVLTKSRLSPWVLNPIAFNGLEDSLGSPVTIYRIIPFGQQACSGIFSQTREIKALFRPPTHSTLRPLSPLSPHQSFSSITELYSVLNKCQACPFTGDKNHCHSCFTVDPFILDYLSLTHFVYLSSITN